MTTLYAVVMAGGAGTRFWPLSRRSRPKQLLPLWDGRTLLELTVERLRPLVPLERLLVVTGRHLADATAKALPDLPDENLVVEPCARNTMPCVALAASVIRRREPEARLGIFTADHYVSDEAAFRDDCRLGFGAAGRGRIATLGIPPTHPETGYGYVCSLPGDGPVLAVDRFVEKPDRERAERYLADGGYFWNAGIFFVSLSKLDDEVARQRPRFHEHWTALDKALASGDATGLADAFNQLDATSVDYAIMEGARDVVVIPAHFGWSDVGHWGALHEVLPVDDDGNVTMGDVVVTDATDSVVVQRGADGRLLAVLGLDGVVVVETSDATLVLPRAKAQRVREIVALLERRGRNELL